MSTESECLTVFGSNDEDVDNQKVINAFIDELANETPSLPGPHGGLFTPYGLAYLDTGLHVEFALCESESPFALAGIMEQFQFLARNACARLSKRMGAATSNFRLILANNNHSELFCSDSPTWGSHENYLVENPPDSFGNLILPFLATRLFAGSGVIEFPSGRFLAGARHAKMEYDFNSETTDCRPIHNLRNEPLMADHIRRWRYHVICGDGHRSQFNFALQFGATMLALKAIFFDPDSFSEFAPKRNRGVRYWKTKLHQFNILGKPGRPLAVDPMAIQIQQVYLDVAYRYAESVQDLPNWVEQTLTDWSDTLLAMKTNDHDWLKVRLDPWIKYELFSGCLAASGAKWSDLPGNVNLFSQLELINQNYHDFVNPSVFDQLESRGLIRHRVSEFIVPGTEVEPYIPNTCTRARARAIYIRDNSETNRGHQLMDWSHVVDHHNLVVYRIDHPFATKYERDVRRGLDELVGISARRIQMRTNGIRITAASVPGMRF